MIERNNRVFFSNTDLSYSVWIINSHFSLVTHKICLGCVRNFYKL